METQRHKWQMDLLIEALDRWLVERGNGYVNGNMFVYYSLEQMRGRYFHGPDCFVVLDVPRGERKSWVIWEQGKGPDVVIELLSPSTADADKGEKKQVYQNLMRVPEYYWFDPFKPEERAGFLLQDGRYQQIEQDANGELSSPLLGLKLQLWTGVFRDIDATWLRWAHADGTLLPTDAEAAQAIAEQQRRRANSEQARADRAEQELARLRALLENRR